MSSKHTIGLTLFATSPPKWSSRDDALDYLQGEFVERIAAIEDLLMAEAPVMPLLLFDLGELAGALARFIREPGQLDVNDQTPDASTLEELSRCICGLDAKVTDGAEVKTRDGRLYDGHRRSRSLLAGNLAHAAREFGANSEWQYDEEMKDRRAFWERIKQEARERRREREEEDAA